MKMEGHFESLNQIEIITNLDSPFYLLFNLKIIYFQIPFIAISSNTFFILL